MTGQTKLEPDIVVWLRQYAHAVWTGEDQGCRMLEAADLIERLRSPAPAEEAIRCAQQLKHELQDLDFLADLTPNEQNALVVARAFVRSPAPAEDGEGIDKNLFEAVCAERDKLLESGERLQEALMDSQYLAGAKAGWNAAQADDPNAAWAALSKGREGYLRPIAERRKT